MKKNKISNISNISEKTQVSSKMLTRQRFFAKHFDFINKTKTNSAISGVHKSTFQGRGMDYNESRVYAFGDDIRNMDWKVTARTGEPHIKLFQEERERPTYIIINSNASMFFGTKRQFKSIVAAKVASILAWASVNKGDRVSLLNYGSKGINFIKPTAGKNGIMKLTHGLLDYYDLNKFKANMINAAKTKQQTKQKSKQKSKQKTKDSCLGDALQHLRKVIKPGSTVIIISDFQMFNNEEKKHLTYIKKYNDVLGVCVCDPFEMLAPEKGVFGVKSGIKDIVFNIKKDKAKKVFSNFRTNLLNRIDTNFIKIGIPVIPIQTDYDVVAALQEGYNNPTVAYNNWLEKIGDNNLSEKR